MAQTINSKHNWHGTLLPDNLPPPQCTSKSNLKARKGGHTTKSEYLDSKQMLKAKVESLCKLIKASKNMVVYTGAGISTASGIADYASSSKPNAKILPRWQWKDAQPTYAHYALTSMYKHKYVKKWINQNHDGLAQKSGFPQHAINEIHGSWFDPSNLVVQFDGDLREDLLNDLEEWEQKCDLCLCLGTSLSGMSADSIAENAQHTVIINLQQTEMDNIAKIRIFGDLDDTLKCIAKTLGIKVSTKKYKFKIPKLQRSCNVYSCRMGTKKKKKKKKKMRLDLRKGQKVIATDGELEGVTGTVIKDYGDGYYDMQFIDKGSREMMTHTLGPWWIEAAVNGDIDTFPVVNKLNC